MNSKRNCKCFRHDRQSVISLALVRYNFSTPDIRLLMRQVLGHAVSGRTIKRLVRSTGRRLKRGRPRSTPRIHKGELNRLVELTSNGAGSFNGNALQLLAEIHVEFGLTPLQYLKWAAQSMRRGKCMMRRCLLCRSLFPSTSAGERHCRSCKSQRNRLIRTDEPSGFITPI